MQKYKWNKGTRVLNRINKYSTTYFNVLLSNDDIFYYVSSVREQNCCRNIISHVTRQVKLSVKIYTFWG